MSKSNLAEEAMLKLIFNGTTFANIADDAASSPATNLTVALHTGDPGEAGNQSTSEATYTGYVRETVARTTGGWTVTTDGTGSVSPVATIAFTAGTGGSGTVTHWSVGTGVSHNMLYSGTVTPNIVTGDGVTPQLTTASAITEG